MGGLGRGPPSRLDVARNCDSDNALQKLMAVQGVGGVVLLGLPSVRPPIGVRLEKQLVQVRGLAGDRPGHSQPALGHKQIELVLADAERVSGRAARGVKVKHHGEELMVLPQHIAHFVNLIWPAVAVGVSPSVVVVAQDKVV